MAIELVRDIMKIDQVVGENSSQVLVEGDIIVPDSKPDIARILQVDGRINVNSIEVVQDKVMLDGDVNFRILYIADGEVQELTSMDATTNFDHAIDIQGAKPKMDTEIFQEIEHVEYALINSRKANVKAVVNIDGKVLSADQLESVKEIKGLDDIQVLHQKVKNRVMIGKGTSQTIVKEDVEIPPEMPSIKEILKNEAKAVVKEMKVSDNKVIVHGDITLATLYLCEEENDAIQFMMNTVPFSHFVEVGGAYQGAEITSRTNVQDIYIEVQENNAGELRIMETELVVNVETSVAETIEREVVTDAYAPSARLELQRETLESQQIVGQNNFQNVVKESITIPDGLSSVSKVLSVDGKPIIMDQSVQDGKVTIEGIMDTNVLYMSNDDRYPLQSFQTEVPFRYDMDIENLNNDCDVDLIVDTDHVSFNPIAPDEIEVKFVLNTKGAAIAKIKQEVVVDVKELEPLPAQEIGGITIYFTQPGDDLWTVAKRFNTTIAGILKYNEELNQGDLLPGTRVLLYKRYTPVA